MNETQAYFWAAFKRHPIRAIRLYIHRRRVTKAVRRSLDQLYEETISAPTFVRMDGESDDIFRARIQKTLEQNIQRELP